MRLLLVLSIFIVGAFSAPFPQSNLQPVPVLVEDSQNDPTGQSVILVFDDTNPDSPGSSSLMNLVRSMLHSQLTALNPDFKPEPTLVERDSLVEESANEDVLVTIEETAEQVTLSPTIVEEVDGIKNAAEVQIAEDLEVIEQAQLVKGEIQADIQKQVETAGQIEGNIEEQVNNVEIGESNPDSAAVTVAAEEIELAVVAANIETLQTEEKRVDDVISQKVEDIVTVSAVEQIIETAITQEQESNRGKSLSSASLPNVMEAVMNMLAGGNDETTATVSEQISAAEELETIGSSDIIPVEEINAAADVTPIADEIAALGEVVEDVSFVTESIPAEELVTLDAFGSTDQQTESILVADIVSSDTASETLPTVDATVEVSSIPEQSVVSEPAPLSPVPVVVEEAIAAEEATPTIPQEIVKEQTVEQEPQSNTVNIEKQLVDNTGAVSETVSDPVVTDSAASTKTVPESAQANLLAVAPAKPVVTSFMNFGSAVAPANFIIGQPVRLPPSFRFSQRH